MKYKAGQRIIFDRRNQGISHHGILIKHFQKDIWIAQVTKGPNLQEFSTFDSSYIKYYALDSKLCGKYKSDVNTENIIKVLQSCEVCYESA